MNPTRYDPTRYIREAVTAKLGLGSHPFRLLLHLEWVLLSISLLNSLFNETVVELSRQGKPYLFLFPSVWPFCGLVIVFGAMGLRLPHRRLSKKILYTGLEFVITGLAGYACYWDSVCFAPMLLVTAVRSCLIFNKVGQIVIAIAIFIFFTVSNRIYWLDLQFGEVFTEESILLAPPEDRYHLESLSPQELALHQQQHNLELFQIQIQNAFFFGLVLVFVFLLVNALIAERRNRRELASAHAQLYEYAVQIEDQATLKERNRIARDIHDSLGHILTAQSIQLDNGLLFLQGKQPKAQAFFQSGKQLSTQALQELRQSVSALREEPLRGDKLETEIIRSANNFKQITGITIDCHMDLPIPVPASVSTAVFRIVEEALTNIYKHSKATQVSICLQIQQDPGEQPRLSFTVEDNGLGFLVDQNAAGFGLKGMHERTVAIGGHLEITSKLGQGCKVSGQVPLGSCPLER